MAEHLNQVVEPELYPFNQMGKPLSAESRQAGFEDCMEMGLTSAAAWECVAAVANSLERDKPFDAQAAAMKFLDLTGSYRIIAVLLATEASLTTASNAGEAAPVAIDVRDAYRPTDEEIDAWLVRSDLQQTLSIEAARSAIDDARTMHAIGLQSPPQTGKEGES